MRRWRWRWAACWCSALPLALLWAAILVYSTWPAFRMLRSGRAVARLPRVMVTAEFC
jgi:hypothetical protein